MTQREVAARLYRLRYEDKWTKNRMAKESGLSRPVIDDALEGKMSERTQIRLIALFKAIPNLPPQVVKKKTKGGAKKRFLIRFFNLKRWIHEIETREGIKEFKTHTYYPRTKDEAGYICTKLDYILKRYLLKVFGAELEKKNLMLGDCYSAEQWIKEIKKHLPNNRRDLCQALTKRR